MATIFQTLKHTYPELPKLSAKKFSELSREELTIIADTIKKHHPIISEYFFRNIKNITDKELAQRLFDFTSNYL